MIRGTASARAREDKQEDLRFRMTAWILHEFSQYRSPRRRNGLGRALAACAPRTALQAS